MRVPFVVAYFVFALRCCIVRCVLFDLHCDCVCSLLLQKTINDACVLFGLVRFDVGGVLVDLYCVCVRLCSLLRFLFT